MKIILKSIGGKEYEKEVKEDSTIWDIKKLLEEDYLPEKLHLCYNGSILEDAKTITDLELKENAVLIIAGSKRKIQKPEPKTDSAAPKPIEKASSLNEPKTTSEATTDKENAKESLTDAITSELFSRNTGGPQLNPSAESPAPSQGIDTYGVDPVLIEQIVAMGFSDRREVATALRAAFMNVERAVEYLCTGMPSSSVEESTGAGPAQSGGVRESIPSPDQRVQGDSDLQRALMNIPQFEEIRAVVQGNPQALATVVEQLQLHHPEIIEMVQQNPEEFMSIMLGNSVTRVPASGDASTPAVLPLGPNERAAVQRLVQLGGGSWNEYDAIEAYRACDENEEAAADLLLNSFFGD
ncbi:UV excision repair RAD23-like protein [Trypanosoma grayi]|uniref:UV excision repair RAD23-like protein n=1 Tax=Trypanosoma grayi TaxID=71804 RepID=UPI0004F46984|nr:UV excision repair RAD23-like protein [Trypanosoma grayi]KEG15497.1 UV excision repair RAD23-like protein [Trypanosoma grayi]